MGEVIDLYAFDDPVSERWVVVEERDGEDFVLCETEDQLWAEALAATRPGGRVLSLDDQNEALSRWASRSALT